MKRAICYCTDARDLSVIVSSALSLSLSDRIQQSMKPIARDRKEADLSAMKEAIKRHYQNQGFEVSFPDQNIRVGNAEIDGEVRGKHDFKIAVEPKGPEDDDIVKGIGQLVEAAIDGYQQAILVVTERRARTARRTVFRRLGIGLVTVDVKGNVKFIVEARDLEL